MGQVSWIQKAINFTLAVTKHTANGFATVPEEEYNKRLSTCHNCDRLSETQECLECGCIVAIKAQWGSESCPLSKWSRFEKPKAREAPQTPHGKAQGAPGGCGCGK